jgi:Pentapeptide repeats (9 copies)
MNERQAEPPSPDGLATPSSRVTNESNLPPIAADADDLKAIKKAVDDAASVGGGLWLSYLFVLFYLAVAAGAVTHADLFFENPVKLPFLNIELPLLAFFFLAPILFLIVHVYTLVHLVMLSDKAKRFHQALHDQIGSNDDLSKDESARRAVIRACLQRQMPSNIFVQFLAGPPEVRASRFGTLLRGIAWVTLVVAPVLLLLMMQIQFLPFHSSFITWTHRIALLAALVLIWWLWREILSGRAADGRRRPASRVWTGLGFALSACAVLFSWTAATFPGEWQEDHWPDWRFLDARTELGEPKKVSLHDLLFDLPVDNTTRHRRSFFSSTLVLPGLNIYEGLRIDDPEKAKWRDYVFRARGRDLKGAILDLASLPRVDFAGAELRGASLYRAQLQRASFENAQLQGASLDHAQLQDASLERAELQDASLIHAQLQGVSLVDAQLQGASLQYAHLEHPAFGSTRIRRS